MLPIGPPGYGDSPYSAQSAFAGSALLVGLEPLVAQGLLSKNGARRATRVAGARVDFAAVTAARDACLREAFAAFEELPKKARRPFAQFREENREWLDDFALFRALKQQHDEAAWTTWAAPLRSREASALREARRGHARELSFQAFVQFQFSEQWRGLRAQARAAGLGLIGDIPLYLAHDSADVWSNQELFELDTDGSPTLVAGVPPDYFSVTGQRWGNPIYAWKRHRRTEYAWWIGRMRSALARFDAVRLDHFIGYQRYWEIPASCVTAMDGVWRPGPGRRFFKTLQKELGDAHRAGGLPFIAEDLGAVTPDVLALRDHFGLPGTKVLQFAFGNDPSAPSFMPHNYHRRAVVYTGTHDNDTTVGWFNEAPAAGASRTEAQVQAEREAARQYLGASDDEAIHWDFVRAALASVAKTSIFPMQDLLGLGSEARMNIPGTTDGNWAWRATASDLTGDLADRLATLTRTFGRAPDEVSK
jgi:4-alpha-glucanotransferase